MQNDDDCRAKRVRFYINETDKTGNTPTWIWIVEYLRKHSAAGATAIQSTMGFGSSGNIHTAHIVDLAADMPVIIEWVDTESRVNDLLPELVQGIEPGLVTVEDVFVELRARQTVRDVSTELTVSTVMTKSPVCVNIDTPVREVVTCMHNHGVRAVPVLQAATVVGIITGGDLLARAGLGARLSIFPVMQAAEIDAGLAQLPPLVAKDVMTKPPSTIQVNATLNRAATMMVHRKLKRLPVVDERETLVGIVSRLDLLRTVTQVPSHLDRPSPSSFPQGNITVAKVMRREVPTVTARTPIDVVLQAVISTRLNLALVVDEKQQVAGIITGAEVLQRVTPDLRQSTMTTLFHRLPFLHPTTEDQESQKRAHASIASELMTKDFIAARPTQHVNEVVTAMLSGAHKIAAVVDEANRLIGVVDRADVLRGLLQSM